MCKCIDVDFGDYTNQAMLPRPKHMEGRKEGSDNLVICVDTCISEEVQHLWDLVITTTGCCCGHNKQSGFIGVIDEDIQRMKELGYEVKFNHCRPESEDEFYTKTQGTKRSPVIEAIQHKAYNYCQAFFESVPLRDKAELFEAGATFAINLVVEHLRENIKDIILQDLEKTANKEEYDVEKAYNESFYGFLKNLKEG